MSAQGRRGTAAVAIDRHLPLQQFRADVVLRPWGGFAWSAVQHHRATGGNDHTLGTALLVESPAWRDREAHLASDVSLHLLDQRYNDLLGDPEQEVAAELRDLSDAVAKLDSSSTLAVRIKSFLASLGQG